MNIAANNFFWNSLEDNFHFYFESHGSILTVFLCTFRIFIPIDRKYFFYFSCSTYEKLFFFSFFVSTFGSST